MTEKLVQLPPDDENPLRASRNGQYQHQTLTLNNTAGMLFMSILAFALLAALMRQQKRYHELAVKLARQRDA
jgi:hypothetical protein